MQEPAPLHLTRLEVFWLLRRLRRNRDAIAEDMLLIEERVRAGHNSGLEGAYRALDGDRAIAEGIIGKLWQIVGAHGEHHSPPPAKKK